MSFEVVRLDTAERARGARSGTLMREHVVTLYNALGEVDRRATYARTVLAGVRIEEKSGAVASLQGESSADGILVFVPGAMEAFVEPELYQGAGWTLREGDLLVVGECELDIPPSSIAAIEATRETYRVKGFETLRVRSAVHHWEVAGA